MRSLPALPHCNAVGKGTEQHETPSFTWWDRTDTADHPIDFLLPLDHLRSWCRGGGTLPRLQATQRYNCHLRYLPLLCAQLSDVSNRELLCLWRRSELKVQVIWFELPRPTLGCNCSASFLTSEDSLLSGTLCPDAPLTCYRTSASSLSPVSDLQNND